MQGVSPGKKYSCTSSARKKKFVPAENPPPPPLHHFSNGPSLSTFSLFNQGRSVLKLWETLLSWHAESGSTTSRVYLFTVAIQPLSTRLIVSFAAVVWMSRNALPKERLTNNGCEGDYSFHETGTISCFTSPPQSSTTISLEQPHFFVTALVASLASMTIL